MKYLYHIAPREFHGKKLIPLNSLKKKYPKLYKEEIKKYKNRKELLKTKIPKLNCLWNDVIHLSPVHPKKMKKALELAKVPKISKFEFFRINPLILNKKKLIVYLYSKNQKNNVMSEKDFEEFKIENLKKYDRIPKETIKYYISKIESNQRPLFFHLIPHIFYKGEIGINQMERIKI